MIGERRAAGTNPRARGTNPRATLTNPRHRGTNPHPGKSEATGQWRAAWRRLGVLDPEGLHRLRRQTKAALRYPGADLAQLGQVLDRIDELLDV